MMACSLILHAGIVALAAAKWSLFGGKERFASVYSVELVSLSDPKTKKSMVFQSSRKAKSAARRQAIPIQRFRPKQQDLTLRKKQGTLLFDNGPKETEPPEKILAKIEKKPPTPTQKEARQGLSQPGASKKAVSLVNIGGMRGGELSQALMLYRELVNDRIQSNWFVPERQIQEKSELEAVVVVRARRDGTVADIQFEKKSGDAYFDDSVLKAVLKSKPFPPFPDIYSPKEEEIVIRFSPANERS
jgi:colicin import membrane protein